MTIKDRAGMRKTEEECFCWQYTSWGDAAWRSPMLAEEFPYKNW